MAIYLNVLQIIHKIKSLIKRTSFRNGQIGLSKRLEILYRFRN